ncbi:MAG: hypothetical protein JWO76_1031 [Nocardioides sp.]|nr:hypothetical protein [Nocardioides sp.]
MEISRFLWMIGADLCTALWDRENVGNTFPKALREGFSAP